MAALKLLTITFCLLNFGMGGYEERMEFLLQKNRHPRACEDGGGGAGGMRRMGLGMTILMLALGILLLLILLGILKGLLGLLFFPKLGMCGMNLLVDLPRPMKHYQEAELAGYPVIYDVAGWPIHPQTGHRSVRPLSRTTEFCMNVIFFLTYPLIILVTCCSFCCYKSYDEEGTDLNVYDNVNTVVFSECPQFQVTDAKEKKASNVCRSGCGPDIYRDDDSAEEHDTRYVMEQMGKSSERLKQ